MKKYKPKDLVGQKFGRLTVIKMDEDIIYKDKDGAKRHNPRWLCNCDCGNTNISIFQKSLLKKNGTKSCGCLIREATIKRSIKHNRYDLSGEYGIGWSNNSEKIFYFDLDDFEIINQYTWGENHNGYIHCIRLIDGKKKTIYMHRLVMGLTDNNYLVNVIDHINGNRTDNRKNNLRMVTSAQNRINQTIPKNNKTGINGVSHREKGDVWIVNFQNKEHNIKIYKNFKTFEEAVEYRKELDEKYNKEFLRQK